MEPNMTEDELKRRAEKLRPGITTAWPYLQEKGYVSEALDRPFDEDMVKYVVREFDELPKLGRGGAIGRGGDRGREDRDTVQASLKEVELEHQAALEQYLAMCAACDADVYRFRKTVLGGHTISSADARKLMDSPAARVLSTAAFGDWGIPFLNHTAELVDHETDLVVEGHRYRATIFVDPPGISRRVEMVTWSGTPQTAKQRLVNLEYPDEESKVRNTQVWSISLLGELREVGEKLSERYRWQPAQAVWFVLTGEIPAVPALTVTRSFPSSMYHHDTLITIEASPWVSSKTVERAFRKAQIKTLGSSGGRPLGMRALKLLRFVIERIESLGIEELGRLEEGKRPPGAPTEEGWRVPELVAQYPWYRKMPNGKRLVREWNDKGPKKWSYGDNTRWFWKDYHRTKKAVAFGPPYQ
jgi:hypothetical protein